MHSMIAFQKLVALLNFVLLYSSANLNNLETYPNWPTF